MLILLFNQEDITNITEELNLNSYITIEIDKDSNINIEIDKDSKIIISISKYSETDSNIFISKYSIIT